MPDDMIADIQSQLTELLSRALFSVAPDFGIEVRLARSRQEGHGDFTSNVALQLAKQMKIPPRQLAERVAAEIPVSSLLARIEVAGAGFINFHLEASVLHEVVHEVLTRGERYGAGVREGPNRVLVEFVSANPTGPLHVGHGRGAAYGASLADILEFAGHAVTREYYVNDAGRQMDILALSTWLRYLDLFGLSVHFPPNGYRGDYVFTMARQLREAHGDRYARIDPVSILSGVPPLPPAERQDGEAQALRESHLDALIDNCKYLLADAYRSLHDFVLAEQLGDCRNDLAEFGVHFDVWFSERSLYDLGLVERALAQLGRAGHLYSQDGALWFRSTAFGDEKDRVVRRENGQPTYFASDIAYHLNKYERGFDHIVNIWGADHHGYIPRVRGAVAALGLDAHRLDIALVQFAVLYRNGQKASMSTRSGEFVTLRALRDEVGRDAARLFYVLRKSDQHLDFDLDLAKTESSDNPVYYLQYAHARIASILREWQSQYEGEPGELERVDCSCLIEPAELRLLRELMAFPAVVDEAASQYAPHVIAFYLKDLAAEFHRYYTASRILVDVTALREARVALAACVRQTLANGLRLLGVGAPETM